MQFDFEKLIKEHFWFLVEDYHLSYREGIFTSNKLEMRIALEREPPAGGFYLPGLYFKLANEPDFTTLTFYWILYYFTGAEPYFNFENKSLDENMHYVSGRLREHSHRIFAEVDEWWLPAQKFRLRVLEKQYRESAAQTFRRLYDYIKGKEAR